MSFEAINWAYAQDLPPGPKFILVTLADISDKNGRCYPGQSYLAKKTGYKERTVRAHQRYLEERHFITRSHRFLKSGQRTSDWCQLSLHDQNDQLARNGSWSESTGKKLQNYRQKTARPPAKSAGNTSVDSKDNRQIEGAFAQNGKYERPPFSHGRSPALIGGVVERSIDSITEQANPTTLFDHHIWLKEKTKWPRERVWSCLRAAEEVLGRDDLLGRLESIRTQALSGDSLIEWLASVSNMTTSDGDEDERSG